GDRDDGRGIDVPLPSAAGECRERLVQARALCMRIAKVARPHGREQGLLDRRSNAEVRLGDVRRQDVGRELPPLLAAAPPERFELDGREAQRVPISIPKSRGSVAATRAGSGARRPSSSARSQAMIALRTTPPPSRLSGSGGREGTRRVASASAVHSSSRPVARDARIWPPSQLGPTPWPE